MERKKEKEVRRITIIDTRLTIMTASTRFEVWLYDGEGRSARKLHTQQEETIPSARLYASEIAARNGLREDHSPKNRPDWVVARYF